MTRSAENQHGLLVDAVGCRRLWCAVIEHQFIAATQVVRNRRAARDVKEARDWFASRGCAEVCTLIGLDPTWIREGAARAFARIDAEGGRKGRLSRWDKGTVQAIFDLHRHVGLTQREIASRFGTSREVIGALLSDFRAAQLLDKGRAA